MKLTGKCKEDFEKWLIDNDQYGGVVVFSDRQVLSEEDYVVLLYDMHESMQYGVYVDFFDSVGIFCEDRRYTDINMAWVVKYPNFNGIQDRFDGLTKTRQESRQAAIEKANELYNTVKK